MTKKNYNTNNTDNTNQESPKDDNENEDTEKLFEFEENIDDGVEKDIEPVIPEPSYQSILYPTQTPQTSQKLNTTSSKTTKLYKVILVKEDSYILDINGTGAGPYQKTTSTQNIKIGDEIELPLEGE